MTLKLRPAVLPDAPVLTDILHRSKASWGYPADKMAEFRKHWHVSENKIASMTVLVAEKAGVPCAFLSATPKDDVTLLVDDLFVDPSAQRRGIGALLLARAEDIARSHRLTRLYLESDLHAEGFYQAHGFKTFSHKPSEMVPGKELPLMEKQLPSSVHALHSFDVKVDREQPWDFETLNAAAIERHWKKAMSAKNQMWNGRNLMLVEHQFENGALTGTCRETSFSSFLAWRDWGVVDITSHNLFGSAVLVSADGALLYGVMSGHTANAGKIYPPGGNVDPDDVRSDGSVDLKAAIYRELLEETGLQRSDVKEGALLIAFDGPRISVAQIFEVPLEAEPLSQKIMQHSLGSEEQELSGVRIIREKADLHDPMIVSYAREIGVHWFDQRAD